MPRPSLARVMAQVPIVYRDAAEIGERRAAYAGALKAWCDTVDGMANAGEIAAAVGSRQPFYLAYQGENDRDLQALYGARICRIMAERYAPVALAPAAARRRADPRRLRQRIFLLSFQLAGADQRLARAPRPAQVPAVRLFHRERARRHDRNAPPGGASVSSRARAPSRRGARRSRPIRPHVLIYPEVGMDAVACQLAAQRLAPVQCNAWGHPGHERLCDARLLSLERPDGAAGRGHPLHRAPGAASQPVGLLRAAGRRAGSLVSRKASDLRPGANVYWSGQSLFKYLPQHDEVFCRIAREVGDCQFVFVGHQQGAGGDRSVAAPARAGVFRAWAGRRAPLCFPAASQSAGADRRDRACDVILDTIGWSGFNSILDTLVHDLPIVTMSGPMMRGRHATAILRMMDVTETIATTRRRLRRDRGAPRQGRARGGAPSGRRYRSTSIACSATRPASPDWRTSSSARCACAEARLATPPGCAPKRAATLP